MATPPRAGASTPRQTTQIRVSVGPPGPQVVAVLLLVAADAVEQVADRAVVVPGVRDRLLEPVGEAVGQRDCPGDGVLEPGQRGRPRLVAVQRRVRLVEG